MSLCKDIGSCSSIALLIIYSESRTHRNQEQYNFNGIYNIQGGHYLNSKTNSSVIWFAKLYQITNWLFRPLVTPSSFNRSIYFTLFLIAVSNASSDERKYRSSLLKAGSFRTNSAETKTHTKVSDNVSIFALF